jgi:hypothetical protein
MTATLEIVQSATATYLGSNPRKPAPPQKAPDPECDGCVDGCGWDVFEPSGGIFEGLQLQRCNECERFASDDDVLALPEAQEALAAAIDAQPELPWWPAAAAVAAVDAKLLAEAGHAVAVAAPDSGWSIWGLEAGSTRDPIALSTHSPFDKRLRLGGLLARMIGEAPSEWWVFVVRRLKGSPSRPAMAETALRLEEAARLVGLDLDRVVFLDAAGAADVLLGSCG